MIGEDKLKEELDKVKQDAEELLQEEEFIIYSTLSSYMELEENVSEAQDLQKLLQELRTHIPFKMFPSEVSAIQTEKTNNKSNEYVEEFQKKEKDVLKVLQKFQQNLTEIKNFSYKEFLTFYQILEDVSEFKEH